MTTLANIRQQHPEYQDMSDEQLAQGLHNRFYSDMPFAEFSRRVGLTATPGYDLAREREDRISGQRGHSMLQDAGDAIVGNLRIGDEIAGGAAYLTQGAENIGRRLTNRPIEIPAAAAYDAASDRANANQRRIARTRPILNAASMVGGALAAGAPARIAAPISAVRAGAASAATQAPFALAGQEGTLPERLNPNAALEIGIAGVLGSGGQAVANSLGRNAARRSARVAQFDRAGVRPTAAAVQGGPYALATKISAESLVGGPAQRGLQASIDDTATATQRLARQAGGAPGTRESVGDVVQRGVQRFARDRNMPNPRGPTANPYHTPARDWSVPAKADALYNRLFDNIERDEAGLVEGGLTRLVNVDNTRRAIAEIGARTHGPETAAITQPGIVERISSALEADLTNGQLRFRDLRAWRTWLRDSMSDPSLTPGVSEGVKKMLYGALSRDISASAEAIAGRETAQQLARVDSWYAKSMQRIEDALQPLSSQHDPGAVYNRIIAIASDRAGTNTRQLHTLREALRPDEWRQVASTIIDQMGRVPGGAADFSVERFARVYGSMTEEGRRVLFGPRGAGAGSMALKDELDNLYQVARLQSGVEEMSNRSRSGIHAAGAGSIASAGAAIAAAFGGNPAALMPVFGGLAAIRLTGAALTNPAFVRWLAGAARGGGTGGAARQLQGLAQLATRDPSLTPIYADLVRSVDASRQRQPSQSQQRPQPAQ